MPRQQRPDISGFSASDWRKLPGTSERYVNVSDPTLTISKRQYTDTYQTTRTPQKQTRLFDQYTFANVGQALAFADKLSAGSKPFYIAAEGDIQITYEPNGGQEWRTVQELIMPGSYTRARCEREIQRIFSSTYGAMVAVLR